MAGSQHYINILTRKQIVGIFDRTIIDESVKQDNAVKLRVYRDPYRCIHSDFLLTYIFIYFKLFSTYIHASNTKTRLQGHTEVFP